MTYSRRPPLAPVLAALCLLLLAACGQKGPLYLPGEGDPVEIDIPLPDEGEEARQEDEDAVDDPR